jgi:heat shock protein HtpX
LVPAAAFTDAPRVSISGTTVIIDADLPSGQPGTAFRCRIQAGADDLPRLSHLLRRVLNHRRSGRVMAGMVLLLALCGWILGGEHGAQWAVTRGRPRSDDSPLSPEVMRQQFGAHLLHPDAMPALFALLENICRRAHVRRPDVYYLAAPDIMNAYALGGPERSAIILTEGLVRGMTLPEIAGILAHEVAHIRNNDTWAMTWASSLQHAITLTSLVALLSVQGRNAAAAISGKPLAALLSGASAIGQLLCLALSRIRELDADATALELIDDPLALIAALYKLERHHAGAHFMAMAGPAQGLGRYLQAHPATSERIGTLLGLTPLSRSADQ